MTRPRPISITDELLTLVLDRAEQTNVLLGLIRDRLPAPPEQVASGEPDRIQIREPATTTPKSAVMAEPQPPAAPRRRGRPPKTRET